MPKLIIHIGSQKTGSTSIQTFLTQNPDKLKEAGLSYVKTARGPAAHNRLVFKRDTERFPIIMKRLVHEIEAAPSLTHIISAEMLFNARMAGSMAKYFPQSLRENTKIVAYIRRQDKFLEAMFKQVVKTGRFRGSPQDYALKREQALKYSKTLDAYAREFGTENIVVLPYEPATFREKNVITDIAPHLDLNNIERSDLPEKFSNVTLSREVSELLGIIANSTDINIAELIRVIIRNNPEGAFHSYDCYSSAECREIVEKYVEDNEYVRATYRKDRDVLFDCSDLEPLQDKKQISSEEQVIRLRQAQNAVFQAIGQSHTSICEPS